MVKLIQAALVVVMFLGLGYQTVMALNDQALEQQEMYRYK